MAKGGGNMKGYKPVSITVGLLLFISLTLIVINRADMFISAETMVKRVIQNPAKAPQEYQQVLEEMIHSKRMLESEQTEAVYVPTYNMSFHVYESEVMRDGADVAIVANIFVGKVDKWGLDRSAHGYILFRLNKINILQQWEVVELLTIPIEEGRTGWSLTEFE